MKRIGHEDIADLCLGSVLLATGGGGDPYVNQLLVEGILKARGPVALVAPQDLADDALVVAIGEAGAPAVRLEHLPNGDEGLYALERLERALGRPATHVIPFEIGGGNSVIPIAAAAAKGIPVVDGDGMGRALPEAQMMTFPIAGIRPTPAVAVDYLGNTILFETDDAVIYERQLRALAVAMGGMVLTAEHPMSGAEARRSAVAGTLSFARAVGRLLRETPGGADALAAPLKKLFEDSQYGAFRHLHSGKVVDFESRMVGGFDVGEARIEGFSAADGVLRIAIKNEYLAAWRDGDVVASVPDLITVLDYESGRPVNAERMSYGQRVSTFAIGCPPHYRTDEALGVVGPRAFGFDFDYRPIEEGR